MGISNGYELTLISNSSDGDTDDNLLISSSNPVVIFSVGCLQADIYGSDGKSLNGYYCNDCETFTVISVLTLYEEALQDNNKFI